MSDDDDDRPDVPGRTIEANVPPQTRQSPKLPWWLVLFTLPALTLILFARACSR